MILALDCGFSTGWARSDRAFGTLDLRCDDYGRSFAVFERWLTEELVLRQPSLMLVERAFMGRMKDADFAPAIVLTAHKLAYVSGIARSELSADQVRRTVFGKARGISDAERIGWAVSQGWRVADNHQADAVALLTAYQMQRVAA